MSDTYYQVVCDLHPSPVVLADVWHDPECQASQRYEDQMRRWDRHVSGEEPMLDRFGNPYPPGFRPYIYRHSSRKITVNPRPHMFVPDLVDPSGPSDINAIIEERAEALRNGQEPPHYHNGYVRVLNYEMDDTENNDGNTIRIGCELCKRTRGKSLFALASADTLAMVLERIGPTLATKTLPLYDETSCKLTDETVTARMVTLYELRKELGRNPRG